MMAGVHINTALDQCRHYYNVDLVS